jgi:hypothetical protein
VLLADRVAMLAGGTIAHVGTHAELLERVPAYRELLSGELDPERELGEDESDGVLAAPENEAHGVHAGPEHRDSRREVVR